MTSDNLKMRSICLLISMLCIIALSSCTGQTGKRTGQGAATGTVAGAVGGMVSALIFGGNVGETIARGAVWGASTGAVAGAIAGGQEDKALNKQEEDDVIKKLQTELGEDAYSGLAALTQCKYAVAISYAQIAQKLDNKAYALAGHWLETLTYADQGEIKQARQMFPAIISADPDLHNKSDVEQSMQKALRGVANIREQHDNARTCAPR